MTDPWTATVNVLAGNPAATPMHWPASQRRRIDLFDDDAALDRDGRGRDIERDVLEALRSRPMGGGEIAYVLGIGLESAYRYISRLHGRGLLRRSGRIWYVTHLCTAPRRGGSGDRACGATAAQPSDAHN